MMRVFFSAVALAALVTTNGWGFAHARQEEGSLMQTERLMVLMAAKSDPRPGVLVNYTASIRDSEQAVLRGWRYADHRCRELARKHPSGSVPLPTKCERNPPFLDLDSDSVSFSFRGESNRVWLEGKAGDDFVLYFLLADESLTRLTIKPPAVHVEGLEEKVVQHRCDWKHSSVRRSVNTEESGRTVVVSHRCRVTRMGKILGTVFIQTHFRQDFTVSPISFLVRFRPGAVDLGQGASVRVAFDATISSTTTSAAAMWGAGEAVHDDGVISVDPLHCIAKTGNVTQCKRGTTGDQQQQQSTSTALPPLPPSIQGDSASRVQRLDVLLSRAEGEYSVALVPTGNTQFRYISVESGGGEREEDVNTPSGIARTITPLTWTLECTQNESATTATTRPSYHFRFDLLIEHRREYNLDDDILFLSGTRSRRQKGEGKGLKGDDLSSDVSSAAAASTGTGYGKDNEAVTLSSESQQKLSQLLSPRALLSANPLRRPVLLLATALSGRTNNIKAFSSVLKQLQKQRHLCGGFADLSSREFQCHIEVIRSLTLLLSTLSREEVDVATMVERIVSEARTVAVSELRVAAREQAGFGSSALCTALAVSASLKDHCRLCRDSRELDDGTAFADLAEDYCGSDKWRRSLEIANATNSLLFEGFAFQSADPSSCFSLVRSEGSPLPADTDAELKKAKTAVAAAVLPYAKYMTERMARTIVINGKEFVGFTETANAVDGDDWMWTDDNAKTIEMLVLPGVYEEVSTVADKAIGFCLEMMRSDFVLRRAAPESTDAKVVVAETGDPSQFRFQHGLMTFRGTAQKVIQSYREDNGQELTVAKHLGFRLSLGVHGRPTFTLEMHELKNRRMVHQLSPEGNGQMVATFQGSVEAHKAILGVVEYTFAVNSSRIATTQRFVFTPSEDGLRDVIKMSVEFVTSLKASVRFSRMCRHQAAAVDDRSRSCDPVEEVMWEAHRGSPVEWWAAVEDGNPRSSYGLYTIIPNATNFLYTLTTKDGNDLDTVTTLYECPVRDCVLVETKLLTAGGLYDDMSRYDLLLASIAKGEDQGMIDYNTSYDIGAELNALASFYLFATTDSYSVKPAVDLQLVKSTVDRHLRIYERTFGSPNSNINNVFVPGLAFVLTAANDMLAATGDIRYARYVEMGMQVSARSRTPTDPSVWRCFGDEPSPALDCQMGMMFAFTRLAATYPVALMSRSPELAAFDTVVMESLVKPLELRTVIADEFYLEQLKSDSKKKIPQLTFQASTHTDNFLWSFKCGLALRVVGNLELSQQRFGRSSISVRAEDQSKLAALKDECQTYLQSSTVEHDKDNIKEVKTALWSAGTSTETQPRAVFGMFADTIEPYYTLLLRRGFEDHKDKLLKALFVAAGDSEVQMCRPLVQNSSKTAEAVREAYLETKRRMDRLARKVGFGFDATPRPPFASQRQEQAQPSRQDKPAADEEEDMEFLSEASRYLFFAALVVVAGFMVWYRIARRRRSRKSESK